MNNGAENIIVSIQCLVYNHEPYLRQCLDGFVMQKTTFKFEAIVHDDVSTDGSVAIIREYAEKFPDIIKPIYEKENQYSKRDGSIDKIMNEACRGKYIAICEGDDYWIDPLKLQKQVDFMESNPEYTLCASNGFIFWDNLLNQPQYFNDIKISSEVTIEQLIKKWMFPTASLLFRKNILDDYPNWAKKIYSGDQTLILISVYKGRVYCLADLTCVYRKSEMNVHSISRNMDKNVMFLAEQKLLLYQLYYEYSKNKYNDIISQKIMELKNNLNYLKAKKRCIMLPLFIMPIFTFKRIIYRLKK